MIDISIPLDFGGGQPNAFGVSRASSEPVAAGELVGDTRQGGSCNFERVTFIPHCNGTHTECVGHITNERISVRDCLKDVLMPARLISIEPEETRRTLDTYAVEFGKGDRVIGGAAIERALGEADGRFSALIVRTLPNDHYKLTERYDGENIPPYFSTEAMQAIVLRGVKHLLVDLPSIDRLFDDGKLSNHRLFWNVEPGKFEANPKTRLNATITELIFVPNEVPDGEYILNLQIAPFISDASPSRPVLLPAERWSHLLDEAG